MSKRNYSQYSKNNNKPKRVNTEPAEVSEAVEEVLEVKEVEAEMVMPEIKMVEETVETVVLPKEIYGIITCARLNIRKGPSIKADVVCVLTEGVKMKLNLDRSTTEWFKVSTEDGVDGWCMRKFVEAKL